LIITDDIVGYWPGNTFRGKAAYMQALEELLALLPRSLPRASATGSSARTTSSSTRPSSTNLSAINTRLAERSPDGSSGDPFRRHGQGRREAAPTLLRQLFEWTIDADNPLGHGLVHRETNFEGVGIGGGIGDIPEGMQGHLTFYIEVADVEAAFARVEKLGGTCLTGRSEVQPGVELGQFSDSEGHMVGLLKGSA
jgi:predicted enzyme related to lactoylglutathione lyase